MATLPFDGLDWADLVVDGIYQSGPDSNLSADPLARLLPVGNQGGFRYSGSAPRPKLVALFSTGGIQEWPDELDETSGTLTYYGDNRHAGKGIHETGRRGNLILRESFTDYRESAARRAEVPVFLYFETVGNSRDIRFRGLVVPGGPTINRDDELVAISRSEHRTRFQNYRATFTVLNVPSVSRRWINDILSGQPVSSNAPPAWRMWVDRLSYQRLSSPPIHPARSKEDQLPNASDASGWELLQTVYESHAQAPHKFESTAVALAQLVVPLSMDLNVTRPAVDGGRDAVGRMSVGHTADPVWIRVALEAKCYQPGETSVGVRDTSRLISRIRYRDLGFLVTTSFVAPQAYREIREDDHPVVVTSGGDIVRHLRRIGVWSPRDFLQWRDRLTN